MEKITKHTKFIRFFDNYFYQYKVTKIKNNLIEYCFDKPNYKDGEACLTLDYFNKLIKLKQIKLI